MKQDRTHGVKNGAEIRRSHTLRGSLWKLANGKQFEINILNQMKNVISL